MKKVLVGAAIATMVFAGAGFAYSARPSAVTPGQYKTLVKRVAALEKSNRALVTYVGGCLLGWRSVTQYGGPPSFGYVFDNDSDPNNGQLLASALDFTASGSASSGYIPVTADTSCVAAPAELARYARVHVSRVRGHVMPSLGSSYKQK
jgi:hypothetical protein